MRRNKEIFCALAHTGKLVNGNSFDVCCRIQRKEGDGDIPGEEYREYIKDNLRRGVKLSECKKCWQEEDAGILSYRESNNNVLVSQEEKKRLINDYDEVLGIRHLEIILSNVCNLACQMCTPLLSTKWMSTVKTNDAFTDPVFQNKYTGHDLYYNTYTEEDIKDLKVIKLMGGEPFYMKESFTLLKRLNEIGRCSEMEFHTPTNCMIFPKKDILDIILSFKKVYVNVSFDGLGELNDYIRMYSNWDQVIGNFKKWHELSVKYDHVSLIMSNTVTILNLNKTHEFINFFLDYLPQHALHPFPTDYPEHLSIALLPKEIGVPLIEPLKDVNLRVYKMIESVIGTSPAVRKELIGIKIRAHFKSVEKVLGKTFKEVNPQMAEIIEDLVGDMK